jgi:hypothetical protein
MCSCTGSARWCGSRSESSWLRWHARQWLRRQARQSPSALQPELHARGRTGWNHGAPWAGRAPHRLHHTGCSAFSRPTANPVHHCRSARQRETHERAQQRQHTATICVHMREISVALRSQWLLNSRSQSAICFQDCIRRTASLPRGTVSMTVESLGGPSTSADSLPAHWQSVCPEWHPPRCESAEAGRLQTGFRTHVRPSESARATRSPPTLHLPRPGPPRSAPALPVTG